jgi:uncharacterized protein (TIRG00374 family)
LAGGKSGSVKKIKKKVLFLLLRAAGSAVLIGLMLFKLGRGNLKNFPDYIAEASYPLLFLAVFLYLAAIAFSAVRWKILLEPQQIFISFSQSLRLSLIGLFFSNFLPGVVGGDAVKLYYVAKESKRTSAPLASILMDRSVGIFAMVFLAVLALLFNRGVPEISRLIPLVFGVFFIMLFIGCYFFKLRKKSTLNRLAAIKTIGLGEKIIKLREAFILYRVQKQIIFPVFFLSLFQHGLLIIVSYTVSQALHINAPLHLFFLFIPLIQFILMIPISISGIGPREGAFILFFSSISKAVSPLDAFALGLGIYLMVLLSSLTGGLIYLVKGGKIRAV